MLTHLVVCLWLWNNLNSVHTADCDCVMAVTLFFMLVTKSEKPKNKNNIQKTEATTTTIKNEYMCNCVSDRNGNLYCGPKHDGSPNFVSTFQFRDTRIGRV